MTIKAKIKAALRDRNLSEVAKESGISRQTIYDSVLGNASPTLRTVEALCSVLGIEIDVTRMRSGPKTTPKPHSPSDDIAGDGPSGTGRS
jgi:DNA-binding phage protein